MRKQSRIIILFILAALLLALEILLNNDVVYLLNFGASSYERVSCNSFTYYPELQEVKCDGVHFFGVKDVEFE